MLLNLRESIMGKYYKVKALSGKPKIFLPICGFITTKKNVTRSDSIKNKRPAKGSRPFQTDRQTEHEAGTIPVQQIRIPEFF